jgi:hypothetical protein
MRSLLGALATAIGLCAAGAAAAAPTVEIRRAVARVIVTPEARDDIRVEIVKANPRLPLRVSSFMGHTYVDGGLSDMRIRGCHGPVEQPSATVIGMGEIPADQLPQVVIHTPMNAKIIASSAVWGQVGRSEGLDLANAGCGDWEVANVRDKLRVTIAGSGAVRTGQAGSAELTIAGSGSIQTHEISGPVMAMDVGSGDINVGAVNGTFNVRVAGAGRVWAASGHASIMHASIAGAGDIVFDGVADSLKASIVGSGDVKVNRVVGSVDRAVIGSGAVRVGGS